MGKGWIGKKVYFPSNEKFLLQVDCILAESEIPKHVGEFLVIDRKVLSIVLDLDDEYPSLGV